MERAFSPWFLPLPVTWGFAPGCYEAGLRPSELCSKDIRSAESAVLRWLRSSESYSNGHTERRKQALTLAPVLGIVFESTYGALKARSYAGSGPRNRFRMDMRSAVSAFLYQPGAKPQDLHPKTKKG